MPAGVDSFRFCTTFLFIHFFFGGVQNELLGTLISLLFQRPLFTTNYASEPLTRSQLISILPDKMFNKLSLPGNKCNSGEKWKLKCLQV